jgi:hypothetical protein
MVYAGAAQKTMAYMTLSLVLGFSIITFLSGDLSGTTGQVVSDTTNTTAGSIESGAWIIFLLGVLIGALAVGTYTYIVHIERKREW